MEFLYNLYNMKAIEYTTLEEYNNANQRAHYICNKSKDYTSSMYAHKKGLLTIKDTYLLILVPQFEALLIEEGFNFKEFEDSYLKINR